MKAPAFVVAVFAMLVTKTGACAQPMEPRVEIIMMDDGRIIEEAPPEQFFTAPKQERTRAFLARIIDAREGVAAGKS